MPKKINLLFLIDSLQTGGAEKLVVDTANYLAEKESDFQVHIATTTKDGGELSKDLNPAIQVVFIDCNYRHIFRGIRNIRRYIRKNNITHIHAHLYHSILIARLAEVKGTALFFTYHNIEYDPADIFFSRTRVWLDKLTLRSRYTSIYVSDPVREVVQKNRGGGKHEYVLYNFPSERFYPAYVVNENEELKLIAVGSLKPVKNFGFLISALDDLKESNVLLDIYGDGHQRQELEDQIAKKGLNSRISLKGKAYITSGILAMYDCFVMCSISEGMPVSLIEAMATGLPSLLPNHLQVMKDVAASSAEYFSIHSIPSFVAGIKSLLHDKEQLKVMSATALELSQKFALSSHMSSLKAIYTHTI